MAKTKEKEIPMMVVQSKLKEYMVSHDLRTSADAITAVNGKIAEMLDAGAARCKENKRQTLKPQDL